MRENHMLSPHTDTMPTRTAATIYEADFWHDRFGMSETMADNMAYLMMCVNQPRSDVRAANLQSFANAIHDEAITIQGEA